MINFHLIGSWLFLGASCSSVSQLNLGGTQSNL